MTLEEEFLEVLNANKKEIEEAKAAVRIAMNNLTSLSEKCGVPVVINPFFDGYSDLNRAFVPESFSRFMEGELNDDMVLTLEQNGLKWAVRPIRKGDDGWEYWQTSSFHC